MNLLPCPRVLKRGSGYCRLPDRVALALDASIGPELVRAIVGRLRSVWSGGYRPGVETCTIQLRPVADRSPEPGICARRNRSAAFHPDGYRLTIDRRGVRLEFGDNGGLLAGIATLRQLLREHGRRLPCLKIRDWPDFPRRGVMLDISRGRVPRLETLLALVEHLADFKVNEFQLYTEHTFAYRRYRRVWRDWGALTARDILKLDARCRELGIDLVPNQNSFGHLRQWLACPPLKELAEVAEPYESAGGDFLRYPATLAPNHPGTLPFLRGLYNELLPHFHSRFFNVGCDETWDLGRGQSRKLCERKGKGRVYLDFLKRLQREVSARGRRMMFWGDIILQHPELMHELPKDAIALNWGYEAGHPFEREARGFAKSGLTFYVCPGTSSWMTLIGRHDNALANLREAARAGRIHGAAGYLITDWGDGGHPQPLAVSYLPYLAGAALGWCARTFDPSRLVPVLSRDVFNDPTRHAARSALALGRAHRKFGYTEANATPFGAVIAASPPETRELFCRTGPTCYARIAGRNIRAALREVERQRTRLRRARPATPAGSVLLRELDLAARMAAQSCRFMLWQQALASGRISAARLLARSGIRDLRRLDHDFRGYWPLRNKGTTGKCSNFLRWRVEDYRRGMSGT
jgi:hexosaminidase